MSLKKLSLILALALTTGCSAFGGSSTTAVARGEYYSAGKPEFDSFFIDLHELQVELLLAPETPRATRQSVTQAAQLGTEASDASLKSRLDQELKKLAAQGLRMRLEVPEVSSASDASATLHTSDSATSSTWRTSLPRDATRLVRSRNRMFAIHEQLEQLKVAGIRLEGSVEQAFRVDGPWKRSEVTRNLEDGQKVITLMTARAREVEQQSSKLLALLAAAATTDPNLGKTSVYASAPAPEPPPRKATGRRPPLAKASGSKPPPSSASKPPANKPSTAAKPRDDDAPAAKPVQGNAPSEIEP
ncbi:MAG TPA: hypothetical protein VIW29_18385 [Polyangiaceae bacterium]